MSAREPRTIRLAEDRWATVRHIVEAVAIIGAGIWGFYVFIYQERIKPASEPAALALSVNIDRLGRDAHREVLRVTMVLRNTGKTEMDIAGDGYNVWGLRFGQKQVKRRVNAPNDQESYDVIPRTSSELVATSFELRDVAIGGRYNFHIIIEPGAQEQLSRMLVVPRGRYDVIDAQVYAVPVKTSLRSKVDLHIVRQSDGSLRIASRTPGVDEDDNETQFALIP
jgi:hypothetical protein